MPTLLAERNRLIRLFDNEILWIEGWGKNALRIRATKCAQMPPEDWVLLPQDTQAAIHIDGNRASVTNGNIRAEVLESGKIRIFNQHGKLLLGEYLRTRQDLFSEDCSALEIEAREFRPIIGGDYELFMRFESTSADEKIYGMGQYQQPFLNLKGADIELAHRNSQASVPFCMSSEGYGLLWNNPAIGRATFGKNVTTWQAKSTKALDYWITAGDTPAEIEEAYAAVAGTVPMMPDYAMGFWQCKLRYQTQEELLHIAREYKRRNLPISVIVIDFFHWPTQGDWRFDDTYWPDPDAMIAELKELGIELMVSVWPTVDYRSENFAEMKDKGYLIRTERGFRLSMDFQGNTVHFDATNPAARDYVWQKAKKNYYDKGIRIFWLDEAEPEYSAYDFDNFRYHLGSNLQIGNVYPLMYAKAFFEGMQKEGQENIINLIRCAWAGSQKYGALVWSGDIHSSWASLRNQLTAGLNMGIAGIPWWTTDIGGFHGGDPNDPEFRELFIRWFQYGTYCPVMRLHGDREPRQPQVGITGGASCRSGAPNEVWSYGDEAYEICKKFMHIRESMKPYIEKIMREAHTKGTPPMRPLFYSFFNDEKAWQIEDQYMFGDDYLVAPVLEAKAAVRTVYLPEGKWKYVETGEIYQGGKTIELSVTLEQFPVFERLI